MVRHHILRPSVFSGLRVTWRDCSREAPPYEIFRKDLLGTPVWMESAQDIATATLRMTELMSRSPGEYFVLCRETGEIVNETAAKSVFPILKPGA